MLVQASLLMFINESLIDDHYMIKEQATGLDINVVGILVKNLTKYCKTWTFTVGDNIFYVKLKSTANIWRQ
jgi:hypothetical protein